MSKKNLLFDSVKIIRDPVHGYITLSKVELDIVDSVPFQRLRDIRQLTCQQVYPSARHTRFEHSLGVLELTKKAVSALMENGVLGKHNRVASEYEFTDNEIFSVLVAALLHDVGHCPFSHLGETELNKVEIRNLLCEELNEFYLSKQHLHFKGDFYRCFREDSGRLYIDVSKCNAAPHEMISCIIFLRTYVALVENSVQALRNEDPSIMRPMNCELVVRCILGLKYGVTSEDRLKVRDKDKRMMTNRRNLLIGLISSSMFDMDKLDYVMRDAFFTGIEVPDINTDLLFRNMYLSNNIELVFTSRAVPILQNLIEARDNLYLWVYNHHTTVYSDFLYAYIFRRLIRNSQKASDIDGKEQEYAPGDYPKDKLFSAKAIISDGVTDSNLLHALNWQYRKFKSGDRLTQEEQQRSDVEWNNVIERYKEYITTHHFQPDLANRSDGEWIDLVKASRASDRERALHLVKRLHERDYLKSWWKRPFEYNAYLNERFSKESALKAELGRRVCDPDSDFSSEFRSQIAKHVIFLLDNIEGKKYEGVLKDGEFFVVQRSNKFYGENAIKQIIVYLKHNEVLDTPHNEKLNHSLQDNEYFMQSLPELMPYKKYNELYAESGFFLYVKRYDENEKRITKANYYALIDAAFVFAAKELTYMEREEFKAWYPNQPSNFSSKWEEILKYQRNFRNNLKEDFNKYIATKSILK